jgi:hypothetical protein
MGPPDYAAQGRKFSVRTLPSAIVEALQGDPGEVAIAAPGDGPGYWAGGPSAVYSDGAFWLAYRLRRPVGLGRGYANVIARSRDGVRFETVSVVTNDSFGSASLERPCLVPLANGGWRLYVSCSKTASNQWWVEAVDVRDPAEFGTANHRVVLPSDDDSAWKDVVVRRDGSDWKMWACRHPLSDGDDQADRMESWYATSGDGLNWDLHGPALLPAAGSWDQRGTRITSVIRTDHDWVAFYDGRESAEQNWEETTGVTVSSRPDSFRAAPEPVRPGDLRTLRYLSILETDDGVRLYFEIARPDGPHELRTVHV